MVEKKYYHTMEKSNSDNSRKKRGKKPGSKKTGGRKVGTPNKKTYWLRSVLEENDFNWGQDFAISMRTCDYDRVRILIDLLPYLNPRIDPKPIEDDETQEDINLNVNLKTIF